MSDTADVPRGHDEDVEAALIEAELFVKYKAPERAITRLQSALQSSPRSVILRERLREYATGHKMPEEAARQCLALAKLYIIHDNFDAARERLLDAKQLDPRISITSGLEAIRQARQVNAPVALSPAANETTPVRRVPEPPTPVALAGDLLSVSLFDAMQILENARLTGVLAVTGEQGATFGRVFFNAGQIAGAQCGDTTAQEAFRLIIEVTTGTFNFEKATTEFPVTIKTASNTNLILETLSRMDEENR